MGDDGRFTARGLRVLAGAVAPILSGSQYVGGILALKTASTVPFRDDQLELMRDIAQACSEAYARADRFVNAWRANSLVRGGLTEWVADGCALDELAGKGRELLDAERAQAVAASDGSIVCSTEAFDTATALSPTELGKPGALLRLWQAEVFRDIVEGPTSRGEIEPLDPDTPLPSFPS
jgi:hypothetical protein